MKVLSFATLCLASLVSYSVKAGYPFVVYSQDDTNGGPVEVLKPVKFDSVLATYKEFIGEKTNVLVFVKEGMTTEEFAALANKYPYLHDRVMGHSYVYSDVQGGFDVSQYESSIHAHSKYSINNLADLDSVSDKISADL